MRKQAVRISLTVAVIALLTWTAVCGPRDLGRYPPKADSPYTLPFDGARWVCQGNNGIISHFGRLEFGYDFYMPQGTPVLCARPGAVRDARADRNAIGRDAPANFVLVDHGDGTLAWYGHLLMDGVLVKRGERVARGQRLALSGWTGRAMIPHLHFEILRDAPGPRTTLPVRFFDAEGDGIPRAPWFARRG